MATKEQMRDNILTLEPENELAKQSTASHSDLKTELVAVKRRCQAQKAIDALPCVVLYRMEDNEILCWRLCRRDTLEPVTGLEYGDQLPMIGEMVAIADDGSVARVSSHREGLGICAGDLSVRENFDPRRIYSTPNGTNVVYMRMEASRVVLWSYKIQSEIAISPKVSLERLGRKAQPVARKKRKMTQKILASYLIAQDPDINPNELSVLLKEAFPSASIKPNGRHGPHYISLSRSGKLPVAPDDDPRLW